MPCKPFHRLNLQARPLFDTGSFRNDSARQPFMRRIREIFILNG